MLSAIAVNNKNRDQAGWFVIGFIFGVFGLIAALIVDKAKDSEPQLSAFDLGSQTKKCPDCAEIIKLEAKVCRFCRHQFSDEEVALQVATAEQEHANYLQAPEHQGPTEVQLRFIEELKERFSNYSTEKLKKMKREGRDSWSEEALTAVDIILKNRGNL